MVCSVYGEEYGKEPPTPSFRDNEIRVKRKGRSAINRYFLYRKKQNFSHVTKYIFPASVNQKGRFTIDRYFCR